MNIEQSYHLEPRKGLLNDPVGLAWFKDQYHVFFQWNSKQKDHSHKEWAHMTSSNLTNWRTHESPLIPSESYDRNGVYSGSSCVKNGQIYSFYTGNRKEHGQRMVKQCLAVSSDGIHFEKKGPVLAVPKGYTQHFRDPRVLWLDNQFIMLIGAQNLDKQGCILLFTSKNALQWTFHHVVGITTDYNMVECPDLVCLDGQQVLIYCPQGRDPQTDACLESFCVYRVLDQDIFASENLDLDSGYIRIESGFDGYAPQTLVAPDKVLIFTWMNRLSDSQEQQLASMADHVHCLTLPRELSLKNGRLIQQPAAELYSLFQPEPISLEKTLTLNQRAWFMQISNIHDHLRLTINHKEAILQWNLQQSTLTLERGWPFQPCESRKIRLESLECLEIFMDISSLEIFVNHGEHVLSARILPTQPETDLILDSDECSASIHLKKETHPFILELPETDV